MDDISDTIEDQGKILDDYKALIASGKSTDDERTQIDQITMLGSAIAENEAKAAKFNKRIRESVAAINEQLATVGKTLDTSSWKIIDLVAVQPQQVEEAVNDALVKPVEKGVVKAKKTWAEWFTDITGTKVDLSMTGGKAGEAYLNGFTSAFDTKKSLFEKLGETFDERDELKAKAEKIKSDLIKLLAIDPNDIANSESFTLDEGKNPSIKKMIDEYNSVMEQLKPTWKDFLEETLGVDRSKFGEDAKKAATSYIEGFVGTFRNNEELAGILGETFHVRDQLKAEAEKLKSDIEELMSINPVEESDEAQIKAAVAVMADRYKVVMKQVLNPNLFPDERIKWQDFLADTLDVDPAEFEQNGEKAAELYISGLDKGLLEARNLSEILGEKFDLKAFYEKERDEVREKIETLLGADNLDKAFTTESAEVKALAEDYKTLSTAIDELSESEVQIISWEDALTDSLERGLEKLGVFSDEARQIIAELGTSLASVSFDSVLSGLSTFGEAIGEGKNASDSMREALASMAQQILDSLPTMFLQAGLQLIAQGPGTMALGLGFVAAGGAASFISGFVSGRTSGNTEANALGGVYGDEFYAAFAKGGTFTNGIVTSPTYFRFARGGGFGTGLMGEAGPEAIMPLTRGSDGSLGVTASGLGMSLQVAINNYGSEEVRAEETTGQNGQRQLEITIGSLINRHISGGMADKAMSSRFGIKAKGV